MTLIFRIVREDCWLLCSKSINTMDGTWFILLRINLEIDMIKKVELSDREIAREKVRVKVKCFFSEGSAMNPDDPAWPSLIEETARLDEIDLLEKLIDSLKTHLKPAPSPSSIDRNALLDDVRESCKKVCERLDAFYHFKNTEFGADLLSAAVQEFQLDTLRVLVALGYDVSMRNSYGNVGMHVAAMVGNEQAFSVLLGDFTNNGVFTNINVQNKDGRTPLMYAFENGKIFIAQELLQSGADPTIKTNNGETVLTMTMAPSLEYETDLIQWLLDTGAKSSDVCNLGITPLIAAARNGYARIVKVLLDDNADVNATDKYGRSALLESARFAKDMEVITLLVKSGADINAVDNDRNTALSLAAASHLDPVEVVRGLLRLGADSSMKNFDGMTPIQIASSLGRTEMVKVIMRAEDEGLDPLLVSRLVAAIMEGDVSQVQSMLKDITAERLTDALSTPRQQCKVLLKASFYGMTEIVEMLIDGGVDINSFNDDRNTALNHAARGNRIEVAKLLIKRGCDVNFPTERRYTPIDFSTSDEMIQLLRENGGISVSD